MTVYKLDRFSRNKYETAIHKKALRDNGVKELSAMENIPDTPEGIILESLLEGMNQYYSAELSQKIKRGLHECRQKGTFTGGNLLYGYRIENKRIVVDPEEAENVKFVFEQYALGRTVREIMEMLNERGVLWKGRPFARCTVYHMLTREHYIGIYRVNGEVLLNTYPAIVPKPLFEEVRAKLAKNQKGSSSARNLFLLKGKIRCGYCRRSVNGESGTSQSGYSCYYYKCANRKLNSKTCKLKPIRQKDLEDLVLQTTSQLLGDEETLSAIADEIEVMHAKMRKDRSVLCSLLAQREKAQKSLNNLLKAIEEGILTATTKTRMTELEEQIALLDIKIKGETQKEEQVITKDQVIAYLRNIAKYEPRFLINVFVKEIVLYNDKIEIYYYYTDKKDPDEPTDKIHRDLTFHHYNVRVRKTYFGLLTKIKKDTAHCSRSSTVSLLVQQRNQYPNFLPLQFQKNLLFCFRP